MPAYLIADVDVTDPILFEQYRAQVPATIAAYGGKYIVRGGKTEVLEGQWQPKRMIVLEFPNTGRLREWYQSKEYAPLMELRKRAAKTNAILLEGL